MDEYGSKKIWESYYDSSARLIAILILKVKILEGKIFSVT
ncbi:MAG: hypothetical protein Ct9H300mP18_08560 [Candidatus Neomarinimicrobiota bacterium]|nr:MAG: hypothetical protein Ct9H300mP18_08560 [Candidatus Neomarinimicrobiota bacterium]